MSYVYVIMGVGIGLLLACALEFVTKRTRHGPMRRALTLSTWLWWLGIAAVLVFVLSGCTLPQIEGKQGRVQQIGGLVAPLADAVAPGSGAAVKVATEIVLGILALFAAYTAKKAHARISKDKRERRELDARHELERRAELVHTLAAVNSRNIRAVEDDSAPSAVDTSKVGAQEPVTGPRTT